MTLPLRAVVTTIPFGTIDRAPLTLLKNAGVEVTINPLGRKLKPHEVRSVIDGFPLVIAGTEIIDAETMTACTNLRAICRVGIGLDGIDLTAARAMGIAVSYTPDGPSPAVAELTVGLILDLLRGIGPADRGMRNGLWQRHTGSRIATSTIGIVGCGRIGRRVIRHLQGGFAGVHILACDPNRDPTLDDVEWVDLSTLLHRSDVVSLHLPLNSETTHLISAPELATMKPSAVLVNTSRGGIVDETDLASALRNGTIKAAAIDVFCEEPYKGELATLENAILSCHMGSMTVDCRARMEIEATEDAIRFLTGRKFNSPVPDTEYDAQARRNG